MLLSDMTCGSNTGKSETASGRIEATMRKRRIEFAGFVARMGLLGGGVGADSLTG